MMFRNLQRDTISMHYHQRKRTTCLWLGTLILCCGTVGCATSQKATQKKIGAVLRLPSCDRVTQCLDPVCYGYNQTCWRPWPGACESPCPEYRTAQVTVESTVPPIPTPGFEPTPAPIGLNSGDLNSTASPPFVIPEVEPPIRPVVELLIEETPVVELPPVAEPIETPVEVPMVVPMEEVPFESPPMEETIPEEVPSDEPPMTEDVSSWSGEIDRSREPAKLYFPAYGAMLFEPDDSAGGIRPASWSSAHSRPSVRKSVTVSSEATEEIAEVVAKVATEEATREKPTSLRIRQAGWIFRED